MGPMSRTSGDLWPFVPGTRDRSVASKRLEGIRRAIKDLTIRKRKSRLMSRFCAKGGLFREISFPPGSPPPNLPWGAVSRAPALGRNTDEGIHIGCGDHACVFRRRLRASAELDRSDGKPALSFEMGRRRRARFGQSPEARG